VPTDAIDLGAVLFPGALRLPGLRLLRPGWVALAPQVLTEFAHVVTDPRRFERPPAMPDALDMCRTWWNASECRQVAPGAEAGNLFLNWMSARRLSGANGFRAHCLP